MSRRLVLGAAVAIAAMLPTTASGGNPSLVRLKIGDAVLVSGTRVACFAITSNAKNGIACVLWRNGKVVAGSYGAGLAVDGTAVVTKVDAKGNGTQIWKKRLPAARGASASATYTLKPGEGFGIPATSGVILGCQVLKITSKQLQPLYRGVKVSCWLATPKKPVPNRYGISVSDKFAGVFKFTPKGALSTWGYVKRQPA